jgi:membrane protein implicated in regulation of membrane protease activity
MDAVNIPLWINIAFLVLAVILVYLLAKFNRKTGSSEREMKQIEAEEDSIRGKVLAPENLKTVFWRPSF